MIRIRSTSPQSSTLLATVQYILIYCALSLGGMALPIYIGADLFLVSILISCSIYLFFIKKEEFIGTTFSYFIGALSISLLLPILFSDLSLGTSLRIICILLLIYTTIHIDKRHVLQRFLQIAYLLAAISIILFFLTYIWGFNVVSPLFPYLLPSYSEGMLYSYTSPVYNFVFLHSDRNCGPFGEPGQFQCMLTVALYFSLFHSRLIAKNRQKKYIAILTIALLTTLSTSGYIAFIFIIGCYLLHPQNYKNKKIKRYFLTGLCGVILFLTVTPLGHNFIEKAVYDKIFNTEKHNIDFTQGTGGARTKSITEVIELIEKEPFSLAGLGYDRMKSLNLEGCAGILSLLIAIGIFPFSILFSFSLWCIYHKSQSKWDILIRILLIINMGLGQPNIMNPALFFMVFYSYLCLKSNSVPLKKQTIQESEIKETNEIYLSNN